MDKNITFQAAQEKENSFSDKKDSPGPPRLPKTPNGIKELEEEIGGDIFKAAYYALHDALVSWLIPAPTKPDYFLWKKAISSMLENQHNYTLYIITEVLNARLKNLPSQGLKGYEEIQSLVDLIVEKEGKEKYGPRKLLRGL